MSELLTDPAVLTILAGAILSILFGFVPGLKDWYADKDEQFKQGFMLFLVITVGVGAAYLEGLDVLTVVRSVLLALIGNTGAFTATKKMRTEKAG